MKSDAVLGGGHDAVFFVVGGVNFGIGGASGVDGFGRGQGNGRGG